VDNKHRLTFGSPLVLVFFLEKSFPKIPNLVWVLKKKIRISIVLQYSGFFREKKKPKFHISFEIFFAHISTVLLVW
jgi:hypothetical protein